MGGVGTDHPWLRRYRTTGTGSAALAPTDQVDVATDQSVDVDVPDETGGADHPEPNGEPDDLPGRRRQHPKLRKVLRYLGIGLGVLAGLYLVLFVISSIRSQPRDDLAFFASRPGDHRPLVFAHQGGEGARPSNTMIAFRHSLDVGADVLDTDMHMTRDGVLVLIHDETVDGSSNGSGEVRNMTLDELRQLDFGYTFSTDDGQTYPYRGRGHGIVTVDELFSEFTDTRFGIEIKQTTVEAATKLCALIEEHDYTQRVVVSSFSDENMSAFRDACPSVATSATTGEARRFYIFQFVRLSGFYSPPFDSLQVPEYRGGIHVLTSSFVGAARSWNLPVVPWTIDEVTDMDRIIADFDPDGINTNYPERLVEYLESR